MFMKILRSRPARGLASVWAGLTSALPVGYDTTETKQKQENIECSTCTIVCLCKEKRKKFSDVNGEISGGGLASHHDVVSTDRGEISIGELLKEVESIKIGRGSGGSVVNWFRDNIVDWFCDSSSYCQCQVLIDPSVAPWFLGMPAMLSSMIGRITSTSSSSIPSPSSVVVGRRRYWTMGNIMVDDLSPDRRRSRGTGCDSNGLDDRFQCVSRHGNIIGKRGEHQGKMLMEVLIGHWVLAPAPEHVLLDKIITPTVGWRDHQRGSNAKMMGIERIFVVQTLVDFVDIEV